MKPLRVGVVGVGHIGKNHARLYAEGSTAEFTAIFDLRRGIGGESGESGESGAGNRGQSLLSTQDS